MHNESWFGAWPPEPIPGYGGEDVKRPEMPKLTSADRWLGVGFLLGVLLVMFMQLLEHRIPGVLEVVVRDIGIGLIVASVIGITVERVMSQRLAKEAVEAGLGYLILPEAREEMRRIYEQQFMCVEHETRITIKPTPDDSVVMVVNYTRRKFRNITGSKQSFAANVRFHEWFHAGFTSKLIAAAVISPDGTELKDRMLTVSTNSMAYRIGSEVILMPGAECQFWYEIEEPRRMADTYYETFQNATVNPLVYVDNQVSRLAYTFGFSSNLDKEAIPIGRNGKSLPGMLLPYGYVECRWYDKNQIKEWHDAKQKEGIQVS